MHGYPWLAVDRTPYIDGPDAELRSAAIDREQADTLAPDDPMRTALHASATLWEQQAARREVPAIPADTRAKAMALTLDNIVLNTQLVRAKWSTGCAPDNILVTVACLAELVDDLAALVAVTGHPFSVVSA